MLIKRYNDIVNFLSFSTNLKKIRSRINQTIDSPDSIRELPHSHPTGFIKVFKRRRTTIVETYLKITKSLESANYSERIHGLSLLADYIIYSRSLVMPLNAARVQLVIMKDVVKNRDNKRLQLELLRDFTVASFGHQRSIRKFLQKFDIVEVPETGEELKDLKMGWDFHVHDTTSYGLKLPTQLMIDAFIKGISELTVVYNNLEREEAIKEVLEAGRVLGIKVNVALEFSAISEGLRFHYLYILPNFSSKKERFKSFLKNKSLEFNAFMLELEENEKKREKNIKQLIEAFNQHHLPIINDGYENGSIYYLAPLSIEEEEIVTGHAIYSHRQLGEMLYPKLKKVLQKRLLQSTGLKMMDENPDSHSTKSKLVHVGNHYEQLRTQYANLDPERVRMEYFGSNEVLVPEIAVSSLEDIYNLANKAGGSIKFIQPLEHGLQAAVNIILDNFTMLSFTEIYNMYGTVSTKEEDFIVFANCIKLLNENDKTSLVRLLYINRLTFNEHKLDNALAYFQVNKLIPAIGSDAAGRSTLAPGMGFVLESRIPKYQRKYFRKHHHILPNGISRLIFELARIPKLPLKANEKPTIICLGKQNKGTLNLLGDQKIEKPIYPPRAWEYLNPVMKNALFILIGFIPAYLTVGAEYAVLWLAITGSRNMFVDVISGNGFKPKEWHYGDINWTNIANALFWTGFSVPILSFIKAHFDIVWTGAHQGLLFDSVKFFCINIANGMYLATHNYLRGFDKRTIRGNFFRSILAWPLAATFSPLGNAMMVPSIVQAKIWSDVVAAIIEGTSKYKNIIRIKYRIMTKLIPVLICNDDEKEKLAMLDMIYFVNESSRSKTAIEEQLVSTVGTLTRMKKKLLRNGVDTKPTESYYELKKRFDDPDKLNGLIDFVIEHYYSDQSFYLVKLVSANYQKVKNWIDSLEK